MKEFLRIAELYTSIQGEGIYSGTPCFFIRTAGCDLRCRWCDTPEFIASSSGKWFSQDKLLDLIPGHIPIILITGGEPLLQEKNTLLLIQSLHDNFPQKKILLETAGHRSLSKIPPYVHIVMDIKMPGSGEGLHDFETNLQYLKPTDEIKFVIQDKNDFDSAVRFIELHKIENCCVLFFSPVPDTVELKLLAEWIIQSELNVRIQIQLHKIIWGKDAKGV